MIRRKGPILAAAVVTAFVLGWYQGLFGIGPVAPDVASVSVESAEQQAAVSSAKGPSVDQTEMPGAASSKGVPSPTSEANSLNAETGKGEAPAPGFDVVRVEPDGSTVVAGKGAANQRIALTDGTRTLSEAQTDANGDFVMSLSIPAGSHRLQLAQRDDVVSDEAAVINVPPAGRPDELLVMVERPGEASEVLQKPTQTAALPERAQTIAPETKEEVAAEPSPEPTASPDSHTAVAAANVSVEAVEIEGDRLFVAGSAASKSEVRIYLDDRFVAASRIGEGDRFVASAKIDVPVGDHMIRADIVDAAGRVVGRVEVPFQRPEGASMAAIAPPPAEPAQAPDGVTVPVPSATPPFERIAATPPTAAPAAPLVDPIKEPDTIVQPPLQASAARVIIRRGDTLWRISRNTYGRGSRYTVIYLANGDQIRDPDRIYPGQVFRMPEAADETQPPRG